jgi:peptidoglycan/LPS O-acetylase OafA/YrhL
MQALQPAPVTSIGNSTVVHKSAAPGHLNWLQSLRAVSVLLVLLFHLEAVSAAYFHSPGTAGFFYFGHCGVDVFFVISGFIMYYMYRCDWSQPAQFVPFLKRRFIRIYPIYWVLTTVLLGMMFLMPGLGQAYKRGFFYITESYSLLHTGYMQGEPVIPAAWSLFHEIKFYLLFSVCILLPSRINRFWLGGWVGLTLCQTVWGFTPDGKKGIESFLFSAYNLQFILGCIVANYTMRKRFSEKFGAAVGLVGLAGFAVACYLDCCRFLEIQTIHILSYSAPAALLVMAATIFDFSPYLSRYTSRLMVFIGDASYSMYLIHYPFYCFCALLLIGAGINTHLGLWVMLAALFLAAFLISALCFALLEKPLMQQLKKVMFRRPKPL